MNGAVLYYIISFAVSIVLVCAYISRYHKSYDVSYSLIFAYTPIINLAYLSLAQSQTLGEAVMANRFTYFDGTFLPLFITMSIFSICGIKIKKPVILGFFAVSLVIYGGVLSIGQSPVYYNEVGFYTENGVGYLTRSYGPLHILYYVWLIAYIITATAIILYSIFKKHHISNKNLILLMTMEFIPVLSFFIEKQISDRVSLLPAAYDLIEIVVLVLLSRLSLYNIGDNVIETLWERGDKGYITFDKHKKFLGCNTTAKEYLPEITALKADKPLEVYDSPQLDQLKKLIEKLDRTGENAVSISWYDSKAYKIEAGYMIINNARKGYQITVSDDTGHQSYIKMQQYYNTFMEQDIKDKSDRIQRLNEGMILGMANMVESRDNSTGGHIRRTSDVMRILVDEIKNRNEFGLDEEYYDYLIKAAPMHDLGKIAVPDAILNKPGKFSPEEFEAMKLHASKGAEMVRTVLKETDDEYFIHIAENVAHYHHERYDGSGYPEKLRGEDIPFEARVMAYADVYDALVSKRCYKDSMTFDQAFKIIEDGVGTQFDPKINPYFVSCRAKLEKYYSESL